MFTSEPGAARPTWGQPRRMGQLGLAATTATGAAVGVGWALTEAGAVVGIAFAAAGLLAVSIPFAIWFTRSQRLAGMASSARAWAVDVALVFVFVESCWPAIYRGPSGVRIADVAAFGLALAGTPRLAAFRSRYMALLTLSFALMCAGALLSATRSGGTSADLDAMLRAGFVMLVLPLALVKHVTSEHRLRLSLVAVVASAAVASLAALITKTTGAWFLPFADHFGGSRAYGLSTHPILFGMVAGSAIPLAIGLAWVGGSKERALAVLSLPLLVVGVVLSASRAPLLATAASALVLFIVLGRVRVRMAFRFALAVIVPAAIAALIFSGSVARLTSFKAEQSSSLRLSIIEAAADDIEANPVIGQGAGIIKGVGGLSPGTTYVQRTSTGEPLPGAGANNIVLGVWRALGVLGVLGLFVALAGALTAGVRTVRQASIRIRTYCVALLASLTAVAGSLFLANEVFERRLWLTAGLLIALAVNMPAAGWSSEPEPTA
jgi:O-antigen ligase